ncbi:putative glucan endo-1,3-beta-D-glucosidase [Helianthus annuus]|uniref:Glucan endo-1,3-beta-D-glucosidase n=1 Tax=Helianthus annuus TaxID=4232 RepID=A0A251VSS4_HELAN|nr:glucan endo-1,3-beta-glucosidase [Helianthus annuus]KAF5823836.1 putative glucan endo-1,3-beta-D-glucosidase [Helianthus annuus]KAJ0628511.1 putative glucan endo-1,3-beta-D-glucosidase [Helianthus annuus]KAJ0949905.1 putative glucan endo-1,3-beta-D-glucosidase [Helianthus annuus]
MASKLLLLGLLVNLLMLTDAEPVGVCNGRNGNNLPSEQDVVTLFQNKGISRMRIYDPNQSQATLEALGGTNIEVMIGVPNDALQSLTDQNAANTWVNNNIVKYSNVNFKYIAVGNEVDPNNENRGYVDFVLPAMQNIHNAIKGAGLDDRIKVSTATYTGLLENTSPPSHSAFRGNVQGFIGPIVKFLVENNLPMLANIYPYFGYLGDPNKNLQYALFTAQGTVVPDDNGLQYSNLFDAMLDAHYAAQARVGGENVEIVVSESGWPSEGGEEATPDNAGTYYKNLVEHVRGATGTPAKQGISIETYLFAMFDENLKGGAETEKHFGIFSLSQQLKYDGLTFN